MSTMFNSHIIDSLSELPGVWRRNNDKTYTFKIGNRIVKVWEDGTIKMPSIVYTLADAIDYLSPNKPKKKGAPITFEWVSLLAIPKYRNLNSIEFECYKGQSVCIRFDDSDNIYTVFMPADMFEIQFPVPKTRTDLLALLKALGVDLIPA